MHFTWISSAEAGKFQTKAKEVAEAVRELGPFDKLVKNIRPELETVDAGQ